MRRIFLLSFVFFLAARTYSQQPLYDLADDYFRSSPYRTSFSQFLQHLMKDPGLTKKETTLRSASTLFSFSASYTAFNPFFFKPSSVDVSLFEAPLQLSDTAQAVDTMMMYQLIAYVDEGEKGLKEIKKEFQKINRLYGKKFSSQKHQKLKREQIAVGEQYNYFVGYRMLSPLSVSWYHIREDKKIALIISIRIKVKENQAELPELLNNP